MVTRGYRKRACGVVLVKRVKNPIKLAREMLVRGETDGDGGGNGGDSDPSGGSGGAQGHSCLGGETVERLAEEWGLEMVDEDYFWTKKRWDEHMRGLERDDDCESRGLACEIQDGVLESESGWDGEEYLPQGTVGCVALDQYGTLCVATSTGGLTNKLPCRIGDTPTIGAGFWAEEWDESPLDKRIEVSHDPSPGISLGLDTLVDGLRNVLGDCIPNISGYKQLPSFPIVCSEKEASSKGIRAVAMSGTGNGDGFLRLAATRTAGKLTSIPGFFPNSNLSRCIPRHAWFLFSRSFHHQSHQKLNDTGAIVCFAPHRSLASAVNQIAGSYGELQRSAGNRWGKTGEGEGGIIGIELVDGQGKVVFDFNCGGMFRCWVDDLGVEHVMVFKDEY